MKILAVADFYLPGSGAGGPVRSISNFVEQYGEEHEFLVVTRDRDKTDLEPYDFDKSILWQAVGKSRIRYLAPHERTIPIFEQLLSDEKPDWIYLNSLFSRFSRMMLQARRRVGRQSQVLLAIRGELDPGAIRFKRFRKEAYIGFAKITGVYRDVEFQASTDSELRFCKKYFPTNKVHVARNLPARVWGEPRRRSKSNVYVYASRISPKKNLEIALKAVATINSKQTDPAIKLKVYGDAVDRKYMRRIVSLAERCGESVELMGGYDHENIECILNDCSFTILPTFGENFGHSIYESAAAGIPFLISDQTPWTEAAEDGAGWALPPTEIDAWIHAFEQSIRISPDEYLERSRKCIEWAQSFRNLSIREHDVLLEEMEDRTRRVAGEANGGA